MAVYDNDVLDAFLRDQGRLFDETVAETREEADEFLDECMAVVLDEIKDVRKYLDGMGMDVSGLTASELAEQPEVFALEDGRYLLVEG